MDLFFTKDKKVNTLLLKTEAVTGKYWRHKQLYNEIFEYLNTMDGVKHQRTNVNALKTDWNITSPEIELLKNYISQVIKDNFFTVDKKIEINFDSFWGNVYLKGSYALEHSHLVNGNYAMVYFLKSDFKSSPLIFSLEKKKIKPKEGNFIIFPSNLMHSVPIQKSNSKRITLAANIRVEKKYY